MMRAAALSILLLASPMAHALTPLQGTVLEVTAAAGAEYQPQSWPQSAPDFAVLLQAIVLHESSACVRLISRDPRDKHSIGCGQITLSTASSMAGAPLSRYMLLHDFGLNIRLSGMYLAYCYDHAHTWERAVVCYNKGLGHAVHVKRADLRRDKYLLIIRKTLRDVSHLAVSHE